MNTNSCLIFAMWIPPDAIDLGYYYLSLIEKYFNKDDVYIGINIGTDLNFINIVKEKFKNVKEVSPELFINSDASGYQAALSIVKKKYDNVVFGHSKGASYRSPKVSEYYRNLNEKVFWSELPKLFHLLGSSQDFGILGYGYMEDGIGPDMPNFKNEITKFCILPYEPILGFYANTFYIIKGNIIDFFLKNQNNFFDVKLNDRYFFESYFCKIPSMMGYSMISLKETRDNNIGIIKIIKSNKI